jgi:hypothetical protein
MSATSSPAADVAATSLLAPPTPPCTAPLRRDRTLELEVVAGGDPVRLVQILAAMVESSPMALTAVTVGERSAYPVTATVITRRRPMRLTLHLRDVNRALDALVVEEVTSIVSTMCTVIERRRLP